MTVHIITADILKTILKTFEAFQKSMKSLSAETLPQGKYFLNVSAHPLFLIHIKAKKIFRMCLGVLGKRFLSENIDGDVFSVHSTIFERM